MEGGLSCIVRVLTRGVTSVHAPLAGKVSAVEHVRALLYDSGLEAAAWVCWMDGSLSLTSREKYINLKDAFSSWARVRLEENAALLTSSSSSWMLPLYPRTSSHRVGWRARSE